MLLRAAELLPHLADPGWVVFDCRHDLMDHARGARLYRAGHIPGAHFTAVETDLSGAKTGTNGRHPLPAPEAFAEFLRRHGVTPASHIVAYDDVGGAYAARLWWLARWISLRHVALLDGGLPRWLADGLPVSQEVPVPTSAAAPLPARPAAAGVLTSADVLARISDATCALIDARAPERYRGETEPIDPIAGHIPGALNRFHKTNLNADLTFRPAAELRREFAALIGDRRPENIAHHCGSGVTGCLNLFAMEYAGLAGSKLYAGSWSEWIADPARPVARG